MARKENEYFALKYQFDKDMNVLLNKFVKEFNLINTDITERELLDDIYRFLSQNEYDKLAYKFVYDSIKIDNPNLSYKRFIDIYAYKSVGNINSINNRNIANRLFKRVIKDIAVLQKRVERINTMKKDITPSNATEKLNSLKLIADTNTTVELNLKKKIKDNERVLKRGGLTSGDRKSILQDTASLKNQLKLTVAGNKIMEKKIVKFERSYQDMTETKLKKEFGTLATAIATDIETKQQAVVFEQALNSSASFPAKTFAQTEFVKEVTKNDIAEFKQEQTDSGDILWVKWTLSPSHNIIDICDEYADADNYDKGGGVYPLDEAPIPVTDSHPNCRCRLVKVEV